MITIYIILSIPQVFLFFISTFSHLNSTQTRKPSNYKMNQQIPNYLSSPVLQKAKETIVSRNGAKHYEHRVGTWMGTLLKNVFAGDPWAITPERRDEYTNKKPDFVIQKLQPNNEFTIHLICEIKKHKGDRMENALNQAVKDIAMTIDDKGYQTDSKTEAFVIIQRGLDIGFFEYHNDIDNLEEEYIDHFRGCVSLTQDQRNGDAVVPDTTPGLKMLMFEDEKLRVLGDTEEQSIREDARQYGTPCIFNLNTHEHEINILINHILTQEPISSF